MTSNFSGARLRVSTMAMAAALAVSLTSSPAAAQETAAASQQSQTDAVYGVPAWDIDSTELPADPAIVFGQLDNGMRYALRRNATPQGGASVRFSFDVGNLEESAAERTAAHYIEHMAFNGSTNIPEGELVAMLERLGLAFGADTNAETWPDRTTYKLDLPKTDDATVDAAMMIMREVAGELTISDAAVERERGIIISEAQVRNDPRLRRGSDFFTLALPDSRLGQRIGSDAEATASINAETLRNFYRAYYRPQNATLVVVGDFDVAAMEQRIRDGFSDWRGTGEAGAGYVGAVNAPGKPLLGHFADPAVPGVIEYQRMSPFTPATNTLAEQREELLKAVAGLAITNRVNTLAKQPGAAMLGGQASAQKLFQAAQSFGLLVVTKDDDWRSALSLAEQEMRRADEFGFTQSEVEEAKALFDSALRNAAAQADGRPSSAIADEIALSSIMDTVVMAPQDTLRLWETLNPAMTADAVHSAFKAAWQGGPTAIHIATKTPIDNFDAEVASALDASQAIALSAPVEAVTAEFAYDSFGAPGTVVSDTRIDDLGIRAVRFANGVQLNMKVTDFKPDSVSLTMEVGQGASAFPQDKPALANLMQAILPADGFAAHDSDELRRILAGRKVVLGMRAAQDALIASGSTTPQDLEFQLKLLAARLTSTGYRPETQTQWDGLSQLLATNTANNPIQLFISALNYIPSGNDTRFGFDDPAALTRVSVADLAGAIEPQLASGSVELGLVGAFDEDAAIAAVAATLGALPDRAAPARLQTALPVTFTDDLSRRTLFHAGAAEQGLVALQWETDDGSDARSDAARELLAAVFGLRMTDVVREELGATYTPEVFSYSSNDYDGFGHITALAPSTPDKMDVVTMAARQIAAELASGTISEDALLRARQPIAERLARAERDNDSWSSVVATAQAEPERLERRRNAADLLASITIADISAAAREYLKPDGALEIRVMPREAAE